MGDVAVAVNPTDERYAYQFVRSAPSREETTESLDQLDAAELLIDNRRKIVLLALLAFIALC